MKPGIATIGVGMLPKYPSARPASGCRAVYGDNGLAGCHRTGDILIKVRKFILFL